MPPKPIYTPALTGPTLDTEIEQASQSRTALIEGLLYEKSTILTSADAGVGKSTILANIIAQASAGLPVFNVLHVPKPILCYYIPFERGKDEITERLKHIRTAVPFDSSNIHVFYNKTFFPDLYHIEDQNFLIESIKRDCGERAPDLVAYDPIYQAVSGGLSNEDKVSVLIRFNVRLMETFECATWLNHHTVKPGQDPHGNRIERDDPYYGSSYLKNHCTGAYYLKKNPEADGTIMTCKKDNLDLLLKKITLYYQPESYTSYMKDEMKGILKIDRLKIVLRQYKTLNKTFTYRQLEGCLQGVSTSYLRNLLSIAPFTEVVTRDKSNPDNTLYTVTGVI